MASRTKTPVLTDLDQLLELVKANIKQELDPVVNTELWLHVDMDKVVNHYQDFLAAVAQTGKFLPRQRNLCTVLRKVFAGDPHVLKQFATIMDKALKYSKFKAKSISSGCKTPTAVLRIAHVWAKHTPEKQGSSQTLSSGAALEAEDASSDVEVLGPESPREEENAAAQKALADAQKMFASSSSRELKRNVSLLSVASSVEEPSKVPKTSRPSTTEAQPAKVQKVCYFFIASKKQYEGHPPHINPHEGSIPCPHFLKC